MAHSHKHYISSKPLFNKTQIQYGFLFLIEIFICVELVMCIYAEDCLFEQQKKERPLPYLFFSSALVSLVPQLIEWTTSPTFRVRFACT